MVLKVFSVGFQATPTQLSYYIQYSKKPSKKERTSIKAALSSTSIKDKGTLLAQLMKIGCFEQISINKTDFDKYNINLNFRQVSAYIKAEKIYPLSKAGKVFNAASYQEDLDPSMPLILDVLEKNKSHPLLDDQTLLLSRNESLLLQEALELLEMLKNNSIMVEYIQYINKRGFVFYTQDKISIFIGDPPFQKKIANLIALKQKTAKNNVKLTKIELDFDGKAFIKE